VLDRDISPDTVARSLFIRLSCSGSRVTFADAPYIYEGTKLVIGSSPSLLLTMAKLSFAFVLAAVSYVSAQGSAYSQCELYELHRRVAERVLNYPCRWWYWLDRRHDLRGRLHLHVQQPL
jgi:hypothetical protein